MICRVSDIYPDDESKPKALRIGDVVRLTYRDGTSFTYVLTTDGGEVVLSPLWDTPIGYNQSRVFVRNHSALMGEEWHDLALQLTGSDDRWDYLGRIEDLLKIED